MPSYEKDGDPSTGRGLGSEGVVGAADAAALSSELLCVAHLPPARIPHHHAWVPILLVGWHPVDKIVPLHKHAKARALCAARRRADQSDSLRTTVELSL